MNDSRRRPFSKTRLLWHPCLLLLTTLLSASAIGCRGSSPDPPKLDATLARFSEAGREAYSEGDVRAAMEEYRAAIARAWAIDDPYESGTNAYNLAACLTSLGDNARARDWLLDARAELRRGNSSVANAWLLEAKIAQDEGQFVRAVELIDRASCARPPCDDPNSTCCCGSSGPCDERCVHKIPCVGDKIREKDAIAQCQDGFTAQIHLARARVVAEFGDVPKALCHFAKACELAQQVCGEDLQAELQNVAAMIHLAKDEYLQAAWHFDKEAYHLRLAKNYRVIPTALELAAAAYSEAGQHRQAADRLSRVARIWYGRGDAKQAWRYLNQASQMVDIAGCDAASIRLAILADEIERTLGANTPPNEESLDGML